MLTWCIIRYLQIFVCAAIALQDCYSVYFIADICTKEINAAISFIAIFVLFYCTWNHSFITMTTKVNNMPTFNSWNCTAGIFVLTKLYMHDCVSDTYRRPKYDWNQSSRQLASYRWYIEEYEAFVIDPATYCVRPEGQKERAAQMVEVVGVHCMLPSGSQRSLANKWFYGNFRLRKPAWLYHFMNLLVTIILNTSCLHQTRSQTQNQYFDHLRNDGSKIYICDRGLFVCLK